MDAMSDVDQELRESLAGLSGLLTDSQSLEVTLDQVAGLAVHAVPGADGAGIALLRDGRPELVVSQAPFVREVDAIQYRLDEGPCVMAAVEHRVQRSGSLGGDARWSRFGPRVGRLGVHSAMSVPLMLPEQVVGVLNLYARGKDAFDETSERLGQMFAGPAAVSVHHAQVLAQSRRLAAQLTGALTTRATIDQALGIVMGQSGCTAAEAFERLRAISQREKVKLADVAARMVDEAVRRARARRRARQESTAQQAATPSEDASLRGTR